MIESLHKFSFINCEFSARDCLAEQQEETEITLKQAKLQNLIIRSFILKDGRWSAGGIFPTG